MQYISAMPFISLLSLTFLLAVLIYIFISICWEWCTQMVLLSFIVFTQTKQTKSNGKKNLSLSYWIPMELGKTSAFMQSLYKGKTTYLSVFQLLFSITELLPVPPPKSVRWNFQTMIFCLPLFSESKLYILFLPRPNSGDKSSWSAINIYGLFLLQSLIIFVVPLWRHM